MHFKSPHSILTPNATHFHLPKAYRRSRSERDLKVLAANVSHNAHRFPHPHRLTQIHNDLLVCAVSMGMIRDSVR
jgi:hypothetical protein